MTSTHIDTRKHNFKVSLNLEVDTIFKCEECYLWRPIVHFFSFAVAMGHKYCYCCSGGGVLMFEVVVDPPSTYKCCLGTAVRRWYQWTSTHFFIISSVSVQFMGVRLTFVDCQVRCTNNGVTGRQQKIASIYLSIYLSIYQIVLFSIFCFFVLGRYVAPIEAFMDHVRVCV